MLQEQPRQDSFRWMILFMLFAATTINYLDRQILSILKPILDQELGWTDAQYGMIMSIFQASYAVGLTMFGWIIDKYGARMGFAISIIWWSMGKAQLVVKGRLPSRLSGLPACACLFPPSLRPQ